MSNKTPDRGFNTVTDSSVPSRQARSIRQRTTLLIICVVVILMLATLLVLAIGAIIHAANGGDDAGSNKKPIVDQGDITWETFTTSTNAAKYGSLVLINQDHKYTFPAEAQEQFVEMIDYYTSKYYSLNTIASYYNEDDVLAKDAMIAADAMLSAMVKATGEENIVINWGYRSEAVQSTLHDSKPDQTKAPGCSDHHSGFGLSIHRLNDKGHAALKVDSEAYQWLATNAAQYGFIIRYPADKATVTGEDNYPEYFRYVGVPHATLMAEKNYCLEEYIPYLAENAKDGIEVKGADDHTYEIFYYTANGETEIRVPTNCAYSISGTNDGGIVVTADRSTPAETETESTTDEVTETETNA